MMVDTGDKPILSTMTGALTETGQDQEIWSAQFFQRKKFSAPSDEYSVSHSEITLLRVYLPVLTVYAHDIFLCYVDEEISCME